MFKLKIQNAVSLVALVAFTQTGYAVAATNTTGAPETSIEKTEQDFDSLGGNGVLLEKAQALNPEVVTTVVQNRIVDRTFRFELSGEYANSFGGDTYIRSGTFALDGRFHFSNRWAIGAKYGSTYNKLTKEGEDMVDRALEKRVANPFETGDLLPDVDYPMNHALGYVEFYPIYGKLSWLGAGISHFDIYTQLGYGNINLRSGTTKAIQGALGLGVWGTEHVTTRLELSYMNYKAKYYSAGEIDMGVTSASFQVGWLF